MVVFSLCFAFDDLTRAYSDHNQLLDRSDTDDVSDIEQRVALVQENVSIPRLFLFSESSTHSRPTLPNCCRRTV